MNLEEIKNLKQKILDCDQIITSQILGFLSNPSIIEEQMAISSRPQSIQPVNLNKSEKMSFYNSVAHISKINLIRFGKVD